MTRTVRHSVQSVVLVGLLAGASGCDWWPPALQERIGKQEAQIKVLQAEKAGMQAQATEMSKTLEDLKSQAAQMEQANNALKTQVQQLKESLAQAEAKAVRPTAATKRKK
jgi:peptidoglycan hydrolase CwlO-like protein